MNALEFFAKEASYSGYQDSGEEITTLLPSEPEKRVYFHMRSENGRYFYEYIILSERSAKYRWFYIHLGETLEELPIEQQYEIIKRMKTIEIESLGWFQEQTAIYERYPLYSVRGTCNMEQKCNCEPICCSVNDAPCCIERKVGCSRTSAVNNPEYSEFLPELVLWMAVCPDLDAVYVMHDWMPVNFDNELYFSFAFLLRNNRITYIDDKEKVKKIYEEYNNKYRCDTSEIEYEMNSWDEFEPDFYF